MDPLRIRARSGSRRIRDNSLYNLIYVQPFGSRFFDLSVIYFIKVLYD